MKLRFSLTLRAMLKPLPMARPIRRPREHCQRMVPRIHSFAAEAAVGRVARRRPM